MTIDRDTLEATVLTLLRAVAPELDASALSMTQPLRRQVDLDSMDWLNFLVSLSERFGVSIPEADYAQLVSLGHVVDYLQARVA
jgi:acyl carrier protein